MKRYLMIFVALFAFSTNSFAGDAAKSLRQKQKAFQQLKKQALQKLNRKYAPIKRMWKVVRRSFVRTSWKKVFGKAWIARCLDAYKRDPKDSLYGIWKACLREGLFSEYGKYSSVDIWRFLAGYYLPKMKYVGLNRWRLRAGYCMLRSYALQSLSSVQDRRRLAHTINREYSIMVDRLPSWKKKLFQQYQSLRRCHRYGSYGKRYEQCWAVRLAFEKVYVVDEIPEGGLTTGLIYQQEYQLYKLIKRRYHELGQKRTRYLLRMVGAILKDFQQRLAGKNPRYDMCSVYLRRRYRK